MFTELLNINDIIITKSFELLENPIDNNIFIQLKMLHQVKYEYMKLLEDVEDNTLDNVIKKYVC